MTNEEIAERVEVFRLLAEDAGAFRIPVTALNSFARELVSQAYEEAARVAEETDCHDGHCCACSGIAADDIRARKDSLVSEPVAST